MMMDAINFLTTEHEFLEYYNKYLNSNNTDFLIEYFRKYKEYKSNNDYAGMIKVLEAWLLYFPIKSRQDVFLEKFPNTKLDVDNVINICPKIIFGESAVPNCNRTCSVCRKIFWSSRQPNT